MRLSNMFNCIGKKTTRDSDGIWNGSYKNRRDNADRDARLGLDAKVIWVFPFQNADAAWVVGRKGLIKRHDFRTKFIYFKVLLIFLPRHKIFANIRTTRGNKFFKQVFQLIIFGWCKPFRDLAEKGGLQFMDELIKNNAINEKSVIDHQIKWSVISSNNKNYRRLLLKSGSDQSWHWGRG